MARNRSRRGVLGGVSASRLAAPAFAQKKADTGASDKEPEIGGISPCSGHACAYGTIGNALTA